jgi:hypothetical protein
VAARQQLKVLDAQTAEADAAVGRDYRAALDHAEAALRVQRALRAQTSTAANRSAIQQLWHLAYREASTLAFADAFRAIMLAFIVATLLVPLLRNIAAPTAPSSNAH